MKGLSLKKKLVFVLLFSFLSMILVQSYLPDSESASAVTTTVDGLIFESGIITGYTGTNETVNIPATINGQAVKSISGAFTYNDTITTVNIAEGVTTIADYAFLGCSNLEYIKIPSTVFTISSGSLGSCESLAQIDLSESNTSFILSGNFLLNAAQTEIIVHISQSGTTDYVVPDTITKIHDFAFAGAADLASVAISANTLEIGIGAFSSCPNLSSLSFSGTNPNYKQVSGVIYSSDGKTLIAYPTGKSDVIFFLADGVETLAPYSFTGCQNLREVTLSSTVSEVSNAFSDCGSLQQIYVKTSSIYFSSINGVLFSKDGQILVQYPGGKTSTTYTMPNIAVSIAANAFTAQHYLQAITLPSSVTFIGSYAFRGCDSLSKLIVPESVTNFASNCLSGAENLKVWGYPKSKAEEYTSANNIPFVAMGSTSEWTYADNGDGTCSITGYTGTSNDVYVPSVINDLWVNTIEYTAFSECTTIEYITFYESVSTIEAAKSDGTSYIFEDCSSLREVYLPASLEKFQTYTASYKPFKGCTALINIIVDDGSSSFYDTDGVLFSWDKKLIVYPSGRTASSYSIPSGTTGISYAAFDNNNLRDLIVPGSVTIINKGTEATFKNNIESVYLEEGVETVAYDAFSKTTAMDIYFPPTVTTITGSPSPGSGHVFYVYQGSAPLLFAQENDIEYVLLCIVTFNSNGGTAVNPQVIPSGYKASEPEGVTKTKSVLLGWYSDVALTNKWDFSSEITQNMALYAKWVEGYPIIYNMNGGVNDPANPEYYSTGTVVLLENPTKDKYTFDGWYTDSSCKLEYKFEAIEKTTTGTVELWADWWIPQATYDSSGSGTIDPNALSDERHPEITQSGFPEEISYMKDGQKITVTGKLYIKYANVEEIAVTYSGHTDKLYKYSDGDERLASFDYSHSFEVADLGYISQDKYLITLRLSTGEFYQHTIPIYQYSLSTEVLHSPYGYIYMSSDSKYELRSMAVANESFELLSAQYISENPEICAVNPDSTLKPLAAGTVQIQTTVTLKDGSKISYSNEFTVMERTAIEPETNENEFLCQCYGTYCAGLPEKGIDPALLELVENIRQETDAKIYVITGYRCEEYSSSLGLDTGSEHTSGTAADLWTKDISLDELYQICDRLNQNGGVGQYPGYIHIDTRGAYVRWTEE